MTKGVFGDKSYEMTPIKDRLRLEVGTQSITLSIPDAPDATVVLAFRSLELIPVAAKAAIEADRQEAQRAGQHGVDGQSRLWADVPLDLAERRQGRNTQVVCAGR
jgi:hypothetical protein